MTPSATLANLLDLAELPAAALPERARMMARFSLMDWIACARAGAREPVAQIVRALVEHEAGRPVAALAGSGLRVPPRAAALANGTISHALDFDDTHFAHVGHPSVAIYPAALAVGEQQEAFAEAVADAFLVGAEASCRFGMVLGRGHYERGFHQTATAGAIGATVAAGRLLGLSREQMRNALSLVGTRASGLKSQFGTMGKPYNAGIAASNGVEAALLAGLGFQSCDDGLGGTQGFVDTHAEAAHEGAAWTDPPPGRFVFEDVKYKLHACCHGTHAMIEALLQAKREVGLSVQDVETVTVSTNPRWLRVCDIKVPRTGLEAKFSYTLLAAMVLAGIDTSADRTYTDTLCDDPHLGALASRVEVLGDEAVPDTAVSVSIRQRGGRHAQASHDLAAPLAADAIERGLRAKAAGLLGGSAAERLWGAFRDLPRLRASALGALISEAA